jgi:hypothetical protein
MNWKKMETQKPRHGQRVFYAIRRTSGGYYFKGHLVVYNPYQDDKKFNPEYWERECEEDPRPYSRSPVSDSDIWCELELPEEEI